MPRPRANWKLIVQLTEVGLSRIEVARQIGCSITTVANVIRPLGFMNPKRVAGAKRGYKAESDQDRNIQLLETK